MFSEILDYFIEDRYPPDIRRHIMWLIDERSDLANEKDALKILHLIAQISDAMPN